MLIKLTEVCRSGTSSIETEYSLREVYVNPEHVVVIREDLRLRSLNESGLINEGLSNHHQFSKIVIDNGRSGSEITVVGGPQSIQEKIRARAGLLKG
jgi:hypothetical protein